MKDRPARQLLLPEAVWHEGYHLIDYGTFRDRDASVIERFDIVQPVIAITNELRLTVSYAGFVSFTQGELAAFDGGQPVCSPFDGAVLLAPRPEPKRGLPPTGVPPKRLNPIHAFSRRLVLRAGRRVPHPRMLAPASRSGSRQVFHSVSLFIFLYLFWLLLSGYFTLFLLSAGAGSALAVVLFARRMDMVDAEGHPIHLGGRILLYWPWLLLEIVKSAWAVSLIILHPKLPISPTLARFKPSQRTDVGLVIHANSITLTPATITIEAGPDEFLVHSLTRAGAESLADSEMDRRVSACEGRA